MCHILHAVCKYIKKYKIIFLSLSMILSCLKSGPKVAPVCGSLNVSSKRNCTKLSNLRKGELP